jgi:hypothetical protein
MCLNSRYLSHLASFRAGGSPQAASQFFGPLQSGIAFGRARRDERGEYILLLLFTSLFLLLPRLPPPNRLQAAGVGARASRALEVKRHPESQWSLRGSPPSLVCLAVFFHNGKRELVALPIPRSFLSLQRYAGRGRPSLAIPKQAAQLRLAGCHEPPASI